MDSKQEYIGLSDFIRVFFKYWYIPLFLTSVFMFTGFVIVRGMQAEFVSQANIYHKGYEKGFSNESGYDILAVSRLPIIYKETVLRVLLQDLQQGRQIPGLDMNYLTRLNLQKVIKSKLSTIEHNDVYYLNLGNETEALLHKLLKHPYYNEKSVRKNSQVNFVGKSYIVEVIFKSPNSRKVAQTTNVIADAFVRKYNRIYGKKMADKVLATLEHDKVIAQQDYNGLKKNYNLLSRKLRMYYGGKNQITVQRIRRNPKVEELQKKMIASNTKEERDKLVALIEQELSTVWVDEKLRYLDPDTKKLMSDHLRAEMLLQQAESHLAVVIRKIEYYKKETMKAIPRALMVINYGEVPTQSQKPLGMPHIILLGVLGFFLSHWIIFLMETTHPGLKVPEFEQATGQKILGMFPVNFNQIRLDKELAFYCLNLANKNITNILVSSLYDKAGKTYLTARTAIYLATKLSKRVLLIDINHDNPSQHKMFRINNKYGFSDLLAGTCDYYTVMNQVHNMYSLTVIPFGQVLKEQHMANLTNKARFADIVNELRKRFDYIIFDGPSIGYMKYLEFIPKELSNTFIVQDAQRPLSDNDLSTYQSFKEKIKGVFINFANKKQLINFFGETYIEEKVKPSSKNLLTYLMLISTIFCVSAAPPPLCLNQTLKV